MTATYVAWMNDPEVTRYLMAGRVPQTAETIRAFLGSLDDEAMAIEVYGRHVGNVMVRAVDPIGQIAEVGIMLGDRSCWGAGVASTALRTFTADLFTRRAFKKLWAGTCNPSCARLFRRCGWAEEGCQRAHAYLAGQWCDHWLFGIFPWMPVR